MHSAASEEQWVAVRALREGRRATFLRLHRATGIHLSTIAKRAQRENWRSPDERPDDAREMDGLPMPDWDLDGSSGSSAAGVSGAAGLDAERPQAPEARIADMLKRMGSRMVALAEAQGRVLSKVEIDTLTSIARLVERQKTPASERAEEKQSDDDDERRAEFARRMDERATEIGLFVGRRMVAERDPRLFDREG